jgi:hypothetical protein
LNTQNAPNMKRADEEYFKRAYVWLLRVLWVCYELRVYKFEGIQNDALLVC